jgi:hypothetical protein
MVILESKFCNFEYSLGTKFTIKEIMETIRLRVDSKIYKNLMWFLKRFSKDEILVVKENDEFLSVKEYLKIELNKVENGSEESIDINQLDKELEESIRKYEA